MKLKLSAYSAIGFGIVIAIVEVIRNWGNWQWWPFWVIDYIIAIALVAGGFLFIKNYKISGLVLSAAWGVTFGAMYMSFWDHVYNFKNQVHGNIQQEPLTYLIGFGLVTCLICLFLSVSGANQND